MTGGCKYSSYQNCKLRQGPFPVCSFRVENHIGHGRFEANRPLCFPKAPCLSHFQPLLHQPARPPTSEHHRARAHAVQRFWEAQPLLIIASCASPMSEHHRARAHNTHTQFRRSQTACPTSALQRACAEQSVRARARFPQREGGCRARAQ